MSCRGCPCSPDTLPCRHDPRHLHRARRRGAHGGCRAARGARGRGARRRGRRGRRGVVAARPATSCSGGSTASTGRRRAHRRARAFSPRLAPSPLLGAAQRAAASLVLAGAGVGELGNCVDRRAARCYNGGGAVFGAQHREVRNRGALCASRVPLRMFVLRSSSRYRRVSAAQVSVLMGSPSIWRGVLNTVVLLDLDTVAASARGRSPECSFVACQALMLCLTLLRACVPLPVGSSSLDRMRRGDRAEGAACRPRSRLPPHTACHSRSSVTP